MSSAPVPLRGKALQIGITCYRGEMRAETCAGVCDTISNGAKSEFRVCLNMRNNITSIELARNLLVFDFMQGDADYLLMVDNDIGFTWADVRKLLDANRNVISGVYPYKNFPLLGTHKTFGLGASIKQLLRQSESVACEYIPGGFVLITRSVIQRLEENFTAAGLRKIRWQHETFHRIFKTEFDSERGILIGEDYAFSEAVREIGITPYSHFGVIVKHFGVHAYGFDWRNMAMSQAGCLPLPTHGPPSDG